MLLQSSRQGPIWRGIYSHRREVPAHASAAGDELIAEMAETVRSAMEILGAGAKPYLWHENLAMAACFVAARQQRVKVLDFGGGPGSGFIQLISSLPAGTSIDYYIVELTETCAAGRKLFAGDGRVQFSTEFPESASAYDIVYVNSALQYVDDYAALLRRLAALQAPWLLLARLAAGKSPTFATQQVNVPGQILPYWFLNAEEIQSILKPAGYDLACDFLLERAYEQGNLPETHRAERMRTMLFVRRGLPPSSE